MHAFHALTRKRQCPKLSAPSPSFLLLSPLSPNLFVYLSSNRLKLLAILVLSMQQTIMEFLDRDFPVSALVGLTGLCDIPRSSQGHSITHLHIIKSLILPVYSLFHRSQRNAELLFLKHLLNPATAILLRFSELFQALHQDEISIRSISLTRSHQRLRR